MRWSWPRSLNFAKGTVVVMDRGYIDYKLFARWTKTGIFFVTRLEKERRLLGLRRPAAAQEWQRSEGSADPA